MEACCRGRGDGVNRGLLDRGLGEQGDEGVSTVPSINFQPSPTIVGVPCSEEDPRLETEETAAFEQEMLLPDLRRLGASTALCRMKDVAVELRRHLKTLERRVEATEIQYLQMRNHQ